jgi:hypothetical protein
MVVMFPGVVAFDVSAALRDSEYDDEDVQNIRKMIQSLDSEDATLLAQAISQYKAEFPFLANLTWLTTMHIRPWQCHLSSCRVYPLQ